MTKTEMIGKLRAAGWRVRDGGWPATRAAEARYDFCVLAGSDGVVTVFPMNERAGTAIRQADDLQCLLKGEKDMICTREQRARPRGSEAN